MNQYISLPSLPWYLGVTFMVVTLICRTWLVMIIKKSTLSPTKNTTTVIYLGLTFWLILQAFLAVKDIYASDTQTFPNSLVKFGILPPLLCLFAILATKKGRALMDSLPLQALHALHIIRIPVELVLYGLAVFGTIPFLMTFEGRNFDILVGLTAPLVAYWGIAKARLNPKVLLAWNLVSLALLLNIVVHALLSAPTPIQQFAFEQPNRAILFFPYVWLPTFVVPVVLFCHVAAIRQLWKFKSASNHLPALKPTLFFFLFLFPLLSFSQTLRTIKVGSYYVIQDSTAALRRDCLFCDPATMPDRIVLDSNHRMIARRTSHPFGYTYYEWKDANYEKSMEQITYKPFIMAYTHFYKNGSRIDTAEHTTTFDIHISYYRNSFQKANPYHGTWTANYIHVKLPSSATDSLIRLYPYLKAYAKNEAEFWRVLNLQESGNIQSNGLIMYAYDSSKQSMGIKPIKKKYKIGQWRYYNLAGKLQKIENNALAVPMQ